MSSDEKPSGLTRQDAHEWEDETVQRAIDLFAEKTGRPIKNLAVVKIRRVGDVEIETRFEFR